jgi:hypothetical protein
VAAAKKAENALGRCGTSSRHITKLKQSIFFRYLCEEYKWTLLTKPFIIENLDLLPLRQC